MQLRAGGYKHLIVGVTGYVLEEDVAEYRNAGADLILSKPLRVNVMNMLLKHMRENGCISVPGMTLRFSQSHPNSLVWVA
jgi:CheY-like chemotaxis protein